MGQDDGGKNWPHKKDRPKQGGDVMAGGGGRRKSQGSN